MRKNQKNNWYTKKHLNFLRKWYVSMSQKDLTRAFNLKFPQLGKTDSQVISILSNHHIRCGRTGRFEKGNPSWNAGTKGICKPNSGNFKKGHVPPNRKPLGSERVCPKDSFILKKIKERDPYTGFPTRFKHKHVHVWEKAHGKTPKGMVVAFRDGNKKNCKLRNLMLISRHELLHLNQQNYKEAPVELKPSILALTKLKVKMSERVRHEKNNGHLIR